MIYVLGDIHFRDDKNYFVEACEKFLNWFSNWKANNSENQLILLGDLVESPLLSGAVADYLERLIIYSKFNSIHICVGNHDKKKFHDENQLAYEFYKNKPNIYVYEKATEITLESKRILILPYYLGINALGLSMSDYYSNIYQDKKHFTNDYDLVVGHFNSDDLLFTGNADTVHNLDKINTKKIILGHIHTRYTNPDLYLGSVFACKKNENDSTRVCLKIDKNNYSYEKLPKFTEFLEVHYPNPLPTTDASVPIYTILNCSSESIALSKYNNIFIKRTTADIIDISSKKSEDINRQFSSIKDWDMTKLFKEFVKSREKPMDDVVIKECCKLLETKNYKAG